LADKILELALRMRLMPECRVATRLKILTYDRVCTVFEMACALPSGIIHTLKANSKNYY
jgi:hypothetical protein